MKKPYVWFTAGLVLVACSSVPLQNGPDGSDSLEVPTSELLSDAPDAAESLPNLTAQGLGDWQEVKFIFGAIPGSPYDSDLSVNGNGISLMAFDNTTYRVSASGVVSEAVRAIRGGNTFVKYSVVKTGAANRGYVAGVISHSGLPDGMYVEKITGLNATPITAWFEEIRLVDEGPGHYAMPGNSHATGVGVDSSGNVYVGGQVCLADGLPASVIPRFDGRALIGGCDQFITKLSAAGVKQWSRILGTTGSDDPGKISVSANGNVFVTGTTYGAMPGNTYAGGGDIYVAKYNSNGVRQWVKQFGSPQLDAARDIAIDTSGRLYIAGESEGALNGSPVYNPTQSDGSHHAKPRDGIIMRLNSNGSLRWTRRSSLAYTAAIPASTSAYSYTYNTDLAVDGANNVYVVGGSGFTFGEAYDLPWPLKFSPSGALVAKGKLNRPSLATLTSNSIAREAIAVGPSGAYSLLRGNRTVSNNIEAYLARYNFNLVLQSSNPADLAP
jgi:Beta-propeller repeat